MWIGPSFSTMPPLMFLCGFGRVCLLIMMACSTVTVRFSGFTDSTFPVLPLRAAGHHLHRVAVTDAQCGDGFDRWFSHRYHTSGASEMILVNFFSRNSRATGPNTRVPTGSFASLISTAALSSKRM